MADRDQNDADPMARSGKSEGVWDSDPSSDTEKTLSNPAARNRAGAYVLGALLAQGGFGTVYHATHAALGTKAAVKLLHPYLASRPDVVLRFEREINVIRRIDHPNVVRILEHGTRDDASPYLAMELLEGVTLGDHLLARGRLRPAEAFAILEPLASALETAHALSVVHRDVKASNVFIATQPDGSQRVVLLDFGVAKLLDADAPSITKSREILGSFACMSPEQIMSQPVDGRADLYGLGVLAYRMLVGELPFQSSLFVVLRELHLHADAPVPSTRAPLNPVFDDVILRALAKNPADRFPTVSAFIEAFRVALGARPSDVGPMKARRAVAVYVEARPARMAIDSLDEDSIELESVFLTVMTEFTEMGLTAIIETGASGLLAATLPDDYEEEGRLRRRVVQGALAAFATGEGRSALDRRVRLRVCVHEGDVVFGADGSYMSGALLDVMTWVPDEADLGVFASAEALRGLGITARGIVGGAGARLRIDAP
jgi:eukaryotic-like serine/threonine-protein kinase